MKNDPESMKLVPWSVFGANSRPGRHQVAPRNSVYSVSAAFWAENVAPRVDCRRRATADTFGCWLVKRGRLKHRSWPKLATMALKIEEISTKIMKIGAWRI